MRLVCCCRRSTDSHAQVSHVRDVGARCFCGWRQGSACGLDANVDCAAVAAALGAGALAERWSAICLLGGYATRSDLFTVMQAYNDARAATPGCDELQVCSALRALRSQQRVACVFPALTTL